MRVFIRIFSISILFISCNKRDRTHYYASELEIYKFIKTQSKSYLIFDLKTMSSLNWPDSVILKYNKDSTVVKLFVRRHDALLDDNTKKITSNMMFVEDFPDLKLVYENKKDSIRKSRFFVIQLPKSVLKVNLPSP